MITGATALEEAVIAKALCGDDEVLECLRAQTRVATVSSRELTGVGFFVDFSVPDEIERVPGAPSFQIGDVTAKVGGMSLGAGFVIFVKQGVLTLLEGFSYDEPWPPVVSDFALEYRQVPRKRVWMPST